MLLEFTFCDCFACCNDLVLFIFCFRVYVSVIKAYAEKEKDWWNSNGLAVLCLLTNE